MGAEETARAKETATEAGLAGSAVVLAVAARSRAKEQVGTVVAGLEG